MSAKVSEQQIYYHSNFNATHKILGFCEIICKNINNIEHLQKLHFCGFSYTNMLTYHIFSMTKYLG